MKLIIDIPDEMYDCIKKDTESEMYIIDVIKKGIPYEPKGDLISRSELKKVLGDPLYRSKIKDYGEILKYTFVMDCINNATAVAYPFEKFRTMLCGTCQANMRVEPERPSGEWIIVKDKKYGDNFKCPFCGKELAGTDLNFCCKCGAKLRRKLP